MVTRSEFEAWQREVCERFRVTNVRVKKVIVFAYSARDMAALRKNRVESVAEKRTLMMHHIGLGKADGVKEGLKRGPNGEPEEVVFAATDTGGLTNVRSRVGSAPPVFTRVPAGSTPSQVYAMWKKASGRPTFQGGIYPSFVKWMASVPRGHRLGLFHLPAEDRIVLPLSRLKSQLGVAYIRLYGSDGQPYARVATPQEVRQLYASIHPERRVVNTNINNNNLFNEFWILAGNDTAAPLTKDNVRALH